MICVVRVRVGKASCREASRREAQRKPDRLAVGSRESKIRNQSVQGIHNFFNNQIVVLYPTSQISRYILLKEYFITNIAFTSIHKLIYLNNFYVLINQLISG